MGKTIPRFLEQLDLIKSFVGLATGAGALYLLYKAVRTGLKCHPPLCSNSPICIARKCPGPGERALPQEASLRPPLGGGGKGDSFKLLFPPSFFLSSGLSQFPSSFPAPEARLCYRS